MSDHDATRILSARLRPASRPPTRARHAAIASALAIAWSMSGVQAQGAASLQDDATARMARLEGLHRDARDSSLPLEARRRAAESLIDRTRDLAEAFPQDPRRGRWLADAAEQCFTIVLPLGGDLDSTLVGLPSHEEWKRTTSAVALMVDLADRAEAASREAVGRLSDPAVPLDEERAALLDQYETVELPRRLPLLRGISEALAVTLVDSTPEQGRGAMGRAALDRLLPLLDELDGDALIHASLATALAAAAAGDPGAFDRAALRAREATEGDVAARRRIEMMLIAAMARRGEPPAALARLRSRVEEESLRRSSETIDHLRRWALLEARIRLDASATASPIDATHWSEPLRVLLEVTPPPRRSATRRALLARLADLAESRSEQCSGAALGELALAEVRSKAGDDAQALSSAERALDRLGETDPWRVAALQSAARSLLRLDRPGEAAERLMEIADRFRSDPEAPEAAEQAIGIARRAAHDAPDSPERARLQRAIGLAVELFPEHPARGRWRVEQVVLHAEGAAARLPGTPSREMLDVAIAGVRGPLQSLPDDDASNDLRMRLALAMATMALDDGDGDAALAALSSFDMASFGMTTDARAMLLLDRRVAALAMLDRDILGDAVVSAARSAAEEALQRSAAAWLATIAPAPAAGEAPTNDPARRAAVMRLVAMLDALGPHEEATERVAAEALLSTAQPAMALARFQALQERHPHRADLLLGEAEALLALPREAAQDQQRLARALTNYQRLLSGREYAQEASERTDLWWHCQFRQLECLDRAGIERAQLTARIERLRLLDPALGGARFSERVARLLGTTAP